MSLTCTKQNGATIILKKKCHFAECRNDKIHFKGIPEIER